MSLIAIGDIHGNLNALDYLLGQVVPELRPEDTLVFLGDYIDRGPDSKGCIDRILQLKRSSPFYGCPLAALRVRTVDVALVKRLHSTLVAGLPWVTFQSKIEKSYSEEVAVHFQRALDEYGARLFEVIQFIFRMLHSSRPCRPGISEILSAIAAELSRCRSDMRSRRRRTGRQARSAGY